MSCDVGKATEGLENEPTSELILQPFFRVSYVTGSSLTSPSEPPMVLYFLILVEGKSRPDGLALPNVCVRESCTQ